jgi:hypothetical protein
MAPAPTDRCYVYGLARPATVRDLHVPGGGVKGVPVTIVVLDDLAAIVSPLGPERVRSSRADLSSHERVVEHVAEVTTVLPLQFGVVMPSADAVTESLLEPNGGELSRLLDDLTGKVELRLRATYMGDVALRDAVTGNRSIRHLQEKIQDRGDAASYHDRIRLGEMVAAALERIRTIDVDEVLGPLDSLAVDRLVLGARSEDVAVHAAFLVEETSRAPFDRAVDGLARRLGHRMAFELVGPLAPWDFVDQDLKTGQEPLPAGLTPGGR